MKKDFRNPSEVDDVHWIYMYSEIDNYHIQKGNSGKWLIFEHINEIDNLWIKIREATINGQFGESSKVSTAKPNRNASDNNFKVCLLYTSPSPRDRTRSRMPSSA